MAVSKLAPQPVAFHAGVFFVVNATYVALIWEALKFPLARLGICVCCRVVYLRPEP